MLAMLAARSFTLLLLAPAAPPAEGAVTPPATPNYRVLLERQADPTFRPAAEALAALHGVSVDHFDPQDLPSLRASLATSKAEIVAFVVQPTTLDVQFAQQLLVTLTTIDDDPFVDITYGFITGRDGPAAERFVHRIKAGRERALTKQAAIVGSWEGAVLPTNQPLSALKQLGFTATQHYVRASDTPETRRTQARDALAQCGDRDLFLFFSHGFPDRMELCFEAHDLREWKPPFAPSVLINCACWNGTTGRWWNEGPTGPVPQPAIDPDRSIALTILDSGPAAYIAGLDPWHGPLAMRYAFQLTNEGCTLGEAAKETFDRLTLEFAPEPIRYPPIAERGPRREGVNNRRHNAAAIVVFGDPAWAPFASTAPKLFRDHYDDATQSLTLEVAPLVDGGVGADFMLPQGRIGDYHSVRSEHWVNEAKLEIVRVIDWPSGRSDAPAFSVRRATVGTSALPCGPVQTLLETTPRGRRLHVRVPIEVQAIGSMWPMSIALRGCTIVLAPP